MLESFAALLFTVLLIGLDAFIDTMVLHMLYKWFVPSVFVAAPVLTMAQIAGLSLTFRVLRGVSVPKDTPRGTEEAFKLILERWAVLVLCLIFGAVIKVLFF